MSEGPGWLEMARQGWGWAVEWRGQWGRDAGSVGLSVGTGQVDGRPGKWGQVGGEEAMWRGFNRTVSCRGSG